MSLHDTKTEYDLTSVPALDEEFSLEEILAEGVRTQAFYVTDIVTSTQMLLRLYMQFADDIAFLLAKGESEEKMVDGMVAKLRVYRTAIERVLVAPFGSIVLFDAKELQLLSQDIIKRRLRRGQAFAQPYLGCRECTAHFGLWEKGEIQTIDETRDLGWMLYDMDYSRPDDIRPMFFRAQMVNGVVDVSNCEVVR